MIIKISGCQLILNFRLTIRTRSTTNLDLPGRFLVSLLSSMEKVVLGWKSSNGAKWYLMYISRAIGCQEPKIAVDTDFGVPKIIKHK